VWQGSAGDRRPCQTTGREFLEVVHKRFPRIPVIAIRHPHPKYGPPKVIGDAGGIVFLHNSEVSIPHIELECQLKPDVVSVGPAADLNAVFGVARGKTCITGNIDPIEVLLRGTPA
jgi:hypothetical protein